MRAFELAEDFFQISANFSNRLGAVNFRVFGITRFCFFGVVADQRCCHLMVFNQTFTYGLFLIIFTGSQFFTGNVVFAFYFRRIEFNVINTTRRRMNAATDDTVNDQFSSGTSNSRT